MDLEKAHEVFVNAFSASKSRTHPYLATFQNGIWVLRDAPRKKERKIEVISRLHSPKATVAAVEALGLPWHFVCHLHKSDEDFDTIRAQYKRLGYRAISTEWMFYHDLAELPVYASVPPVMHVRDQAVLDSIPQPAPQPWRLPVGIGGKPARLYCAWDGDGDRGWVTSVPYKTDAWVSNLHVRAEYRRQGFGRALMAKLLADDKAAGVQNSVLLASGDGAKLYPLLGYKKIATLQMFCPAKR